jgi:hypothetical protein
MKRVLAARWVMLALQLLSLVGLWWLFATTVQGDVEQPVMFNPSVVVLGLALAVGYRWLVADNRRAPMGVAL